MVNTQRRQMSDAFATAIFIILSGGLQDAYTYCCRGGVFANAQTGNIVLMGTRLFQGDFSGCVRYLIPILSFICGIFVAESIHARYKCAEKIHWRQIIILVEILILFGVGFLPQSWNAAANALVSFVCLFPHPGKGRAPQGTNLFQRDCFLCCRCGGRERADTCLGPKRHLGKLRPAGCQLRHDVPPGKRSITRTNKDAAAGWKISPPRRLCGAQAKP